jgi:hypothetical protein
MDELGTRLDRLGDALTTGRPAPDPVTDWRRGRRRRTTTLTAAGALAAVLLAVLVAAPSVLGGVSTGATVAPAAGGGPGPATASPPPPTAPPGAAPTTTPPDDGTIYSLQEPGPENGHPPFNDDPVDLQISTDANRRITVRGKGVPGGRKSFMGGDGGKGLVLRNIRPGTRLSFSVSGAWPSCSYWSEDQPVAGDPNTSIAVKVSEKASFTLVVPSLPPGATRAPDIFEDPAALWYRPNQGECG